MRSTLLFFMICFNLLNLLKYCYIFEKLIWTLQFIYLTIIIQIVYSFTVNFLMRLLQPKQVDYLLCVQIVLKKKKNFWFIYQNSAFIMFCRRYDISVLKKNFQLLNYFNTNNATKYFLTVKSVQHGFDSSLVILNFF